MKWPWPALPVFPTHFDKSTICDKFDELDAETWTLASSVWTAARTFAFDDATKLDFNKSELEWPDEPMTMLDVVAAVMLYCDYLALFKSYCKDLTEWAEENGEDAMMSAMEDRMSNMDDVCAMARDVATDVKIKGRVDKDVADALGEMFSMIDSV
jgi:hypothetical protein